MFKYPYPYLLAKTLPPDKPKYKNQRCGAIFREHINAVMKSAVIILDRLGEDLYNQFGFKDISHDYLRNTVILGAFLHDLGKCSEHFQEMVYLKSDSITPEDKQKLQKKWNAHSKKQMLRHEVISAILALTPELRGWLENPQKYCLITAICSAMGHHLKLGIGIDHKPNSLIADFPDGTGSELRLFTHHEDFHEVLKRGKKYLGLSDPPQKLPKELWQKDELKEAIATLQDECLDFSRNLTEEQRRFIAVVKALVISADLAGSAIPAVSDNSQPLWQYLEKWIIEVLNLTLTEDDLQNLIHQRLGEKSLRPFQEQIANTPTRVTIVKAGCGTGKTIGAYAWAKQRAIGRKLFFCYPTTGTASQGYLDYAAETEIESALMHSRASIDLEKILSACEDDDADGIDDRLEAMTAWQAKLIVCTVDTVLGLVQNNRKPLFSFPAIAQGAFVFDEVHAFDEKLFGALLRFLQTFRGAPILLMSASLSPEQESSICRVIEGLGETVNIIQGEQKLEIIPRYSMHLETDLNQIWEQVQNALTSNQKVLWVTNTVKDCISIYRQAEKLFSNVFIYHSRYRYKDRLEKHKQVITAFKGNDSCLAVTTQVCEMSLDLSADLLISQVAPAYALIQRMGRLNRYVYEDELGQIKLVSGKICPAIFYPKDKPLPYSEEEVETGLFLIDQLKSKPEISQQDLAEISAQMQDKAWVESASIWLDKTWETYPKPLREGGYTMTVIMERDLETIKQVSDQRSKQKKIPFPKAMMQEIQRWTLPIKVMKNYKSWKRWKFYYRVPDECINYSEITGGEELCN
ncbi:MAG: CRISPR-associated helicase Cas3' [Pseudanabaenaceae cyanobacterium]